MEEAKSEKLSTVFDGLIQDYESLHNSLNEIYNESQNIRILSFNSSIEAARAGAVGKGFRVIANEIKNISEKNDTQNQTCQKVVDQIETKMHKLIGIRTAEMAFDTIDKVDRNLFERYCDVQAWATFGKIIDCLANPTEEKKQSAEHTIENLVRIYEVYHDILLTDTSGTVVCVGVNKNLRGRSMQNTKWFKETSQSQGTTYSDMYYSESVKDWTVSYSCPVRAQDGTIVGIISTRFNWKFILNIISSAKVSHSGEIFIINKDGLVIASKNKDEILKRRLTEWEAFEQISQGQKMGFYTNKTSRALEVFGYSKTPGYNSYKGKEWSVVIKENY